MMSKKPRVPQVVVNTGEPSATTGLGPRNTRVVQSQRDLPRPATEPVSRQRSNSDAGFKPMTDFGTAMVLERVQRFH